MESTLRGWHFAALLFIALCSCGTPDTGYKRSETKSAAYPRVRELRNLLLLPPSFEWTDDMGGNIHKEKVCSDTEGVQRRIEQSVVERLTDWKDYLVIRPDPGDREALASAARLRELLTSDADDHPFPERLSAELQAVSFKVGERYGAAGVLVVNTRETGMTAGIFAKSLAIALPTLGIGGMAYVGTMTGSFANAAIYDTDGNLQWWFRGHLEHRSLCAGDIRTAIAEVFDTLPNAKPLVLAPTVNLPP